MIQLTLATAGLAVLGVLAVRVGVAAHHFSRAVADSSERIGRAAADLERAAAPLAARSGQLHRSGVPRD